MPDSSADWRDPALLVRGVWDLCKETTVLTYTDCPFLQHAGKGQAFLQRLWPLSKEKKNVRSCLAIFYFNAHGMLLTDVN